jgi:hypothetical protein
MVIALAGVPLAMVLIGSIAATTTALFLVSS